jgi:hypothetical protein
MNLDWVAGFYDGEGCISIGVRLDSHHLYGIAIHPMILLSQKNTEILSDVRAFLGYGCITGHSLAISAHSEIQQWLSLVGPHCIVKQPQVKLLSLAMQHLTGRKAQRIFKDDMLIILDCVMKLRQLNSTRSPRKHDIAELRNRVLTFDHDAWRRRISYSRSKIWRKNHPDKPPLSVQEVKRLYWEEQLTLERIGRLFNREPYTISYFMRRNAIPRRSPSESTKLRWRLMHQDGP